MLERDIQHAIRLASSRIPGLTLWRQGVGVATTADGRKQRFGLCVGSSDLVGVLAPSGRFVAVEVKTDTGRLRPEQELFLALVRRSGGIAFVARSVDDFLLGMKPYIEV